MQSFSRDSQAFRPEYIRKIGKEWKNLTDELFISLLLHVSKKNPGRCQHPGPLIFEQIIISYVFQLRKYF
jgi:hypothetical protein